MATTDRNGNPAYTTRYMPTSDTLKALDDGVAWAKGAAILNAIAVVIALATPVPLLSWYGLGWIVLAALGCLGALRKQTYRDEDEANLAAVTSKIIGIIAGGLGLLLGCVALLMTTT